MTILGVVLAGGRSVRFGSDKAMARFDGRSLLEHAIGLLVPVCDEIVIGGRDRGIAGIPAIDDMPRDDLGPLGGLCAALAHAVARGHAAVLSVGCDTPQLDRAVIDRLLAAPDAAYVAGAPIIGRWPVAMAGALLDHLETGDDRSVRRWADAWGASAIAVDGPVPNLNRPEDLAALRSADRG